MRCEYAGRLLMPLLMGELLSEDRHALWDHLDACPRCLRLWIVCKAVASAIAEEGRTKHPQG